MSDNKVLGEKRFTSKDVSRPVSLLYRYKDSVATLVYEDKHSEKKVLQRPFNHIFSQLNTKVLDLQNDIILPNNCIYRALLDNGEEAYLIQEPPGIRTFRLSNRDAVEKLVSKMYNKFTAQTRVLEKNEVEAGKEAEVKKTIALRNQYISKQKLMTSDDGELVYKYHFRVYFPYTYLLIALKRTTTNLSFSRMSAKISLTPINTMNDYVYQFPLSNVSENGAVCTGSLPLGEFGYINVKSFVEKMAGYFWNNRFNADISSGPNAYGNHNFLGNWFEWEFKSFLDPAAVLALNFDEESITKSRESIGHYIYSKDNEEEKKVLNTIDEWSIIDCFENVGGVGDTHVNLAEGTATKQRSAIAESIEVGGYDVPVGTILHAPNDKKFKIASYDGFQTYDVTDSTMNAADTVVTHVVIRGKDKKTYRLNLEKGLDFILKAYRKAKNFVEEAVCGDITFKIGDTVAIKKDVETEDVSSYGFDMIKSIRENDGTFYFNFFKRERTLVGVPEEAPTGIKMVEFMFNEKDRPIKPDEYITFRTQKLLRDSHKPVPYTIKDHLSSVQTGWATVRHVKYQLVNDGRYGYQRANQKTFVVHYAFNKDGHDAEDKSLKFELCDKELSDDKITLFIPLPKYVTLAEQAFEEIIPTIHGSETVVIGQNAYQAVSAGEQPEEVPFKIMRGTNGEVSISTVREARHSIDNTFFYLSIDHIKKTIGEIDGVKAFKIRDMFETGTDREHIIFKVGDEVMLASDWNPKTPDIAPSIKKIHDFITIEDFAGDIFLKTEGQTTDDFVTSGMSIEGTETMELRYGEYFSDVAGVKKSDTGFGQSAKCGTLFAILDDGSENLTMHPMIDSFGQHFLNGISHVTKQVGDIKVGDFIKANVAKIPFFPKKEVDEIMGFVPINKRELAILKSGYTMWADIIERCFKVFKRDKLTDSKVEFYEGKTRTPDLGEFMIMYGDMYMPQFGMPLMTKPEIEECSRAEDFVRRIYDDEVELLPSTINMSKEDLDELIEKNGSTHFMTYARFIGNTRLNIRYELSMSSFRCLYSHVLGGSPSQMHIANLNTSKRFYDICYAVHNRSLTNGAAYMTMDNCFHGPMYGYRYYSSPFKTSDTWGNPRNRRVTMLTFPTPRLLKNMTRKKQHFTVYKQLGPQNIFYNKVEASRLMSTSSRAQYVSNSSEDALYNITSDAIFPEVEVEPDIDVTDLATD